MFTISCFSIIRSMTRYLKYAILKNTHTLYELYRMYLSKFCNNIHSYLVNINTIRKVASPHATHFVRENK